MIPPQTRYAESGGVRIAYQMLGDGPIDLVWVPGLVSSLDTVWDDPACARFCRRLAQFCRLILFDKRGTGLSDRKAGLPGLETRIDDLGAVLDSAGCENAAVLGFSEGGPASLMFAAIHPQRVRALVAYGTYAVSPLRSWPEAQFQSRLALFKRVWGKPILPPSAAPSMASDTTFRRAWARFERRGASPAAAVALLRMDHDIDIRALLPAVRVPVLVMHRTGDLRIGVESSRYLAEHLSSARYVELPGADHLPYIGETDRLVAEIEAFVTAPAAAPAPDRALTTVLATLTADASEAVDALVQRETATFGGRVLGRRDGALLAGFDGPARAVRCAGTIARVLRAGGVAARHGLHAGEAARSGTEGDTVGIACDIAGAARRGETLASGTVHALCVGARLRFRERGLLSLARLPEPVALYAATVDPRRQDPVAPVLGSAADD